MSAELIGRRGVQGRFFRMLDQATGSMWVDDFGMYFPSDQAEEIYVMLGMVPGLREWVGDRLAHGLSENEFKIRNVDFELTIEVFQEWLRRDKTGQLDVRINDVVTRTLSHWASLCSGKILTGETTVCFDGAFYFDTTHTEGASGPQNNIVTLSVANAPTTHKGTKTAPTAGTMSWAFQKAIERLLSFTDDQGEPLNEFAKWFAAMVPVPFWAPGLTAIASDFVGQGEPNALKVAGSSDFGIKIHPNTRLTAGGWTTKFVVARTDAMVKALIRQEELLPQFDAIGLEPNSELRFQKRKAQFGVHTCRNVEYGDPLKIVLVELTD